MGIYLQKRKDGSTYGTYVVDRVIKGHRLKLTTGTQDLRTATRMDDVIRLILDSGLDFHLKHLKERKVTLRQLYDLQQKGQLLNRFHNPEAAQPLEPALSKWIATYKGYSKGTRKGNTEFLGTMYKKLGAQFAKPLMEDIPKMLRKYRDICETRDRARTFNLTRAIFFRFLKLKMGKQSELHQQATDIEKLPDKPKNPQTAKTPEEIETLTAALRDKYRGMVWTMCTTGVGWLEYGQMTVNASAKPPHVHIAGTKMDRKDARRRRMVPFVLPTSSRVGSEKNFRKVLVATANKLGLNGTNIYTFRKCYANWLLEAGVPQWRIEMYMGHQPQNQTQKYQMTEVSNWLKDDAECLRSWIKAKRTAQPHSESSLKHTQVENLDAGDATSQVWTRYGYAQIVDLTQRKPS